MKPTNAITVLVISCFLAAGLPGAVITAEAGAGPSVFLPETNFGFKSVMEGTVVEHAFVVRNLGAELLEIQRIKTG